MYTWRDFGREAEFIVASYLRSKKWNVQFSPASRGAADLVAKKNKSILCIQVKASTKSPHITSEEINRLKTYAYKINGTPTFASVQPWSDDSAISIGQYSIFLYSLTDWKMLKV